MTVSVNILQHEEYCMASTFARLQKFVWLSPGSLEAHSTLEPSRHVVRKSKPPAKAAGRGWQLQLRYLSTTSINWQTCE